MEMQEQLEQTQPSVPGFVAGSEAVVAPVQHPLEPLEPLELELKAERRELPGQPVPHLRFRLHLPTAALQAAAGEQELLRLALSALEPLEGLPVPTHVAQLLTAVLPDLRAATAGTGMGRPRTSLTVERVEGEAPVLVVEMPEAAVTAANMVAEAAVEPVVPMVTPLTTPETAPMELQSL